MSYTLRAGISTGRIDTDMGTFHIDDSRVTVDDYDTASKLVKRYSLSWMDGDPGATPETLPDDSGGNDSPADSSGNTSPQADATDADGDGDAAESDEGSDAADGDDADDGGTCGYYDPDSMTEPCKRDAGWGRDADSGRCKDHHGAQAEG